jgi:hypothetical protein
MMYRFSSENGSIPSSVAYHVQSISTIIMGSIMQIPAIKLPISVRIILRRVAVVASACLTSFRLKSDFGEGRVDVVR